MAAATATSVVSAQQDLEGGELTVDNNSEL